MDKKWKEEQLERVELGISIFQYIPASIGKLVYCDTTESRDEPLEPEDVKRNRIWCALLAVLAIGLAGAFIYLEFYWGLLVPFFLVLYTLSVFGKTLPLEGTDYFVGEKGYAVIKFTEQRDHIIDERVVLFEDMSYFFTGETIKTEHVDAFIMPSDNIGQIIGKKIASKLRGEQYVETEYFFRLYGKDQHGECPIYETEGKYKDEWPKDSMNPLGANEEYCFMKALEEQWTSFFCDTHQDDAQVSFAINKDGQIQRDAIILSPDYFIIEGARYDLNNYQLWEDPDNDSLVVELMPYAPYAEQADGPDEGEKTIIPLYQVGNRKAFLMFCSEYAKYLFLENPQGCDFIVDGDDIADGDGTHDDDADEYGDPYAGAIDAEGMDHIHIGGAPDEHEDDGEHEYDGVKADY